MLTFKSHISLSFSYQGFLKEYLKNMNDLNVSLSVCFSGSAYLREFLQIKCQKTLVARTMFYELFLQVNLIDP